MLVAALVAFGLGYTVGALPVAWLLVRHRHGVDMRDFQRSTPSGVGALFAGGVRTAIAAGLLECAKGAVVGVVARLYSHSGWFIAAAVAGCVVGDAFPLLLRRSGRGLLPLVTALLVALPTAGLVTAIAAVPAGLLTSMRGRAFDTIVAVAVPTGLLIGTDDWGSLVPAAVIVAAILLRQRIRRGRRSSELGPPGWRGLVLDADVAPGGGAARRGRQNPHTWES